MQAEIIYILVSYVMIMNWINQNPEKIGLLGSKWEYWIPKLNPES